MNLTLIRGLPGSGKSTLAANWANNPNTSIHLEADQYFTDPDGKYLFDSGMLTEAHDWCQRETYRALNRGLDVYVSNTFTTLNELRPYFDIAEGFDITPTVIVCQNDWGSVHDVPVGVYLNMKKRFAYDISSLLLNF